MKKIPVIYLTLATHIFILSFLITILNVTATLFFMGKADTITQYFRENITATNNTVSAFNMGFAYGTYLVSIVTATVSLPILIFASASLVKTYRDVKNMQRNIHTVNISIVLMIAALIQNMCYTVQYTIVSTVEPPASDLYVSLIYGLKIVGIIYLVFTVAMVILSILTYIILSVVEKVSKEKPVIL